MFQKKIFLSLILDTYLNYKDCLKLLNKIDNFHNNNLCLVVIT
jgi:hypothetical protein